MCAKIYFLNELNIFAANKMDMFLKESLVDKRKVRTYTV